MRARKNTPRRCFAEGGKVDPEQLMRNMAAKYGGGAATSIAADPPPPPPVTEVAMVRPEPPKPGLIGKAMGILGGRKEMIDKAAGYANGGVIRDGNSFSQDMTPDNLVQAAPLVTPVGTTTPTPTPEPARDQHGNDMTFTNKMKAQLGEAPVGIAALPATPTAPTASSTPSHTTAAATNGGVVQPIASYQAGSVQDPKTTFATAPTATAANTVPLPTSPTAPVPQITSIDNNQPSGLRSLRGYAHGGKIKGPGTSTSDSIDGMVRETQEPIKVSTDERILSAAQDGAMESVAKNMGFDSLDSLLEHTTGKPVGPTIKAGKRAAATGGTFADVLRDDLDNKTVTPTVGIAQMRENIAATQAQAAQAATPSAPTAQAPQVVQPGSPVSAPAEYNPVRTNNPYQMSPTPASGQQGTKIELPSLPAVSAADIKGISAYTPVMAADPHVQAKSASSYPQGVPNLSPEQSTPNKSPMALAREQEIPKSISALVSNAPGQQSTPTGTVDVGSTSPGGSFQNGNKTYSVAATKQDGITKVTSPGKAPTFTNVDAMQAVGQLNAVTPGAPTVSGMDLKGANESMAKANAIRQSMIDGDGTGPKVTMIENSGLKESQALMDKWDMERLARQNPQAAGIMAEYRVNTDRNASEVQRDQTTRRGQDITAKTQAAQLTGNPTDNALKQTSIAMNQHALEKAGKQDSMLETINKETDPARRRALMDNLLVSQGKNPAEHRYLKVEGGEEIGPDGFTKVKRPSGVYDTISGKFIPMTPDAAPATVAAAPKVGEVRGGYKFKGGNPANQSSWEKA